MQVDPTSAFENLKALAEAAVHDEQLQETFKKGSPKEKRDLLNSRGFSDAEIEALAEQARALTPEQQARGIGYWLW
jgi:hypothetical protein